MQSKNDASNPRTHLAWLLVGFMVTFLAGDRILAMLDMPNTVANTKAPARMLARYPDQNPPADVVFLGCSYTSFGIDPETVDATARDLGVNVRSLNLGFGGAISLTNTRLCELWLERNPETRVIYYELSPGILNTRVPSLRYGVGQIGGPREAAVLWHESPRDRSTAILSQTLVGFHQWNDIRAITECLREGAPLYRPKYERSPQGWLAWQAGDVKRDATIAKEIAKRDVYWGPFEIKDYALDAVDRLLELAAEHDVQVRFFEMRMASEWARITRPDVEQKYAAAIAELRKRHGDAIDIMRAPEGLIGDEDYFDADHMMPSGARKFSRVLAADLVTILRGQNDSPRSMASRN